MNIVILSGRITKNIEVNQTQNGGVYTRFTIAVDKYQGKDKEKKTNFVDCVAFSHSANFLSKYCSKGSFVTINGELDSTIKEREDGSKVTYWNVIVNSVEAMKPTEPKPAAESPTEPILPTEPELPFEV